MIILRSKSEEDEAAPSQPLAQSLAADPGLAASSEPLKANAVRYKL